MRRAMRVLTMLIAISASAHGATFVVAPSGKDDHPGTKEQPLATLEAARDAARKAGAGPHRIVVMPGECFLTETFELDARDNGLTIEAGEGGKAALYGGVLVTGWRRDGEELWCADLPGLKEGTWDFRALVAGGRMPQRARLPESGTFLHRSVFDVRWLSSVGGGWERKPTQEELTTMQYDPRDVPATLEVRNAEVRVYHSPRGTSGQPTCSRSGGPRRRPVAAALATPDVPPATAEGAETGETAWWHQRLALCTEAARREISAAIGALSKE
ncbi:MAG TPA: hypothetical protein VMY37_11040 [Thermoguttaceae bacterium]|nr:hypothetical protein [Thermoguttaceae bacterium]